MTLAAAASSAVAAWKLDEASGTRVDQVGSNDLTDNNTVGQGTGKVNANCADFESANSEYLSIADNTDLSMGDIDFMVRCWFKLESFDGTFPGLMVKGPSSREYLLYINGVSQKLDFQVYDSGGNQTSVVANNFGVLSTATWYLVHAWHDATNNLIGISVNAGTADTTATSAGVRDLGGAFEIGRLDASFHFDGLIDDAVILKNRFLDATERTEDYNGGTGVAYADWAAAGGRTTKNTRSHPLGISLGINWRVTGEGF